MRALLLLLMLALMPAACGYKGPLYLPKPEAQKPANPPASQKEDEKKPGTS